MNQNNHFVCLSYFLDSQTPLYGGEKGISIQPERSISAGDTANTKRLTLHNHSGTHIDFPNHFFDTGKMSDEYDASFWICNFPFLLEVAAKENELIDLPVDIIKSIPEETDFLVIKTGFGRFRSEEKYWKHNPGLVPELAAALRARCNNLRVVGMDFISLTSFQNREIGRKAHREFLGNAPILLVEDMDLSRLTGNPEQIMCFPLLVRQVDGVPVTIIAKI